MNFLKNLYKKKINDFTIEIITYFNFFNILILFLNTSAICDSAAFVELSKSQLKAQICTIKKTFNFKYKNKTISLFCNFHHSIKSYQIYEIFDDEKAMCSDSSRNTATS